MGEYFIKLHKMDDNCRIAVNPRNICSIEENPNGGTWIITTEMVTVEMPALYVRESYDEIGKMIQ